MAHRRATTRRQKVRLPRGAVSLAVSLASIHEASAAEEAFVQTKEGSPSILHLGRRLRLAPVGTILRLADTDRGLAAASKDSPRRCILARHPMRILVTPPDIRAADKIDQ